MRVANKAGLHAADRVELDYLEHSSELLENLSGCAANGPLLWTVSDEGRTIACLERHDSNYSLTGSIKIDHWVSEIPGEKGDELDLESLDFASGFLWVCGAHCKVRRKPQTDELLNSEIRERKSRRLLARIAFESDGRTPTRVDLRKVLEEDLFLSPYRELPTKENGIDIEGMAVIDDRIFVGLRGPLVGGFAVVFELYLDDRFRIASLKRHFLKLDGLAVRELARVNASLLVIAGPVGESQGPFALYRWNPEMDAAPTKVFAWGVVAEKPEGMCITSIEGKDGLLVLYDSPQARIRGATFEADWFKGI